MKYEIVEDGLLKDSWRVEAIGVEGEVYQALFMGPQAKERAEEYANWRRAAQATTASESK